MKKINHLREKIDDIDNEIVAKLAQRFELTKQVSEHKAAMDLPARDESREAVQYQRIKKLAEQYGLDPDIAKSFLNMVIEHVVAEHKELSRNNK